MNEATGNLPEGDHVATWDELQERFGVDPRRRRLLRELDVVLKDLIWKAGVGQVWLDGSFISLVDYTEAGRPRDIDVAYEATAGTDPLAWDQAKRDRLKKRRKIDLLPSYFTTARHDPTPILDNFRLDEHGRPRGLVVLTRDTVGGTA